MSLPVHPSISSALRDEVSEAKTGSRGPPQGPSLGRQPQGIDSWDRRQQRLYSRRRRWGNLAHPAVAGRELAGAGRSAGQFSRWGPSGRHRGRTPRGTGGAASSKPPGPPPAFTLGGGYRLAKQRSKHPQPEPERQAPIPRHAYQPRPFPLHRHLGMHPSENRRKK